MLRLQHVALSTPSVLPLSSHYQHRISSGICDFPSSGFTVTGFIKCNEYSCAERSCKYLVRAYRYVSSDEEDEESGDGSVRFEEAVKLFNERKYYACHDLLESLWFDSYDPLRTLLHGLLQCAVAFYHLFNQNHKGAMMEMGEGLCKLRKLNFKDGPFHEFEQQISSVLNFIYQTQLELAACNEDFCLTMEQTERSYQLLEGFGAGQQLYFLEEESSDGTQQHTYIVFDPQRCYGAINVPITRGQVCIVRCKLAQELRYLWPHPPFKVWVAAFLSSLDPNHSFLRVEYTEYNDHEDDGLKRFSVPKLYV